VPRYLSDEWIAALDQAAGTLGDDGDDDSGAAPVVIQHVVVDGPEGVRRYHLVVTGTRVAVREGQAEHPTLTFTEDYATAVAVSDSRISAQAAFMAGRLRVGGDLDALATVTPVLTKFGAAIRSVRDDTEYD